MPHPTKLSEAEITKELAAAPGWARHGDKIGRQFQFKDFVTAWSFMAGSALVAERLGHHPEWFNVYHTVKIELSTHDAGGLTLLDFELARAMTAIAAPLLG
ncbi:MAG: putative pterin-4a-carbinolamine dehydratase [Myxococcales bacterium]|nr:putative pterin-4a-carbinolamine dehydratase [Myxococcales bacterium]